MNRAGVYLDYAGAAPAPPELLKNVLVHLMTCPPQGNPHTTAAAGFSQSDVISEARLRVLAHIHADPRQYDVIFTSGATAAIKMVGEVFPNTAGSMLCYSKNSHTSILGLRHFFDHAFCLPATFVTDSIPALDGPETQRSGEYSLIATPAECNFSGFKMDIIAAANAVARMTDKSTQLASIKVGDHVAGAGTASSSWLWLLDAAKYAATSDLDISLIPSQQRPHFICLSFYKIFGYPTGLGCAVVRRDIAGLLRKGLYLLLNAS